MDSIKIRILDDDEDRDGGQAENDETHPDIECCLQLILQQDD